MSLCTPEYKAEKKGVDTVEGQIVLQRAYSDVETVYGVVEY